MTTSTTPALPQEVITCLQNARFLHLATCNNMDPHVSLMNYTYLPSSQWTSGPAIIMTTPADSKKTENLRTNPRVSLLVHDWIAHRPPTLVQAPGRDSSPPPPGGQSRLASLLLQMNAAELSRISATITGTARIVETHSVEEAWLKARHLENNTFEDPETSGRLTAVGRRPEEESGDGGRGRYIEGDMVQVIVVNIIGGRTVDWKGGATDWTVDDPEPHITQTLSHDLVNGIS